MLLLYWTDCCRPLLTLSPQTKPRILICTPSNAACDELLTRVMTDGFCDGSGALARGAGALRCWLQLAVVADLCAAGCCRCLHTAALLLACSFGHTPAASSASSASFHLHHSSQAAHTGPMWCVWAARWAAPSTPLCATGWWA